MNRTKLDAAQVWRDIEDRLVPRLRPSLLERVVYSLLIRHTRLEGRPRLRCSLGWLAARAGLSPEGVRRAVRSLAEKGALRILSRSKRGHVVSLRLPGEIPECREQQPPPRPAFDLEAADFLRDPRLREAIHRREQGRCFYCCRRLRHRLRELDHVFPLAALARNQHGRRNLNSYRNLVSCCEDCNSQKRDRPAADFLRALYRDRRLNAAELADRLTAIQVLACGQLKPVFAP